MPARRYRVHIRGRRAIVHELGQRPAPPVFVGTPAAARAYLDHARITDRIEQQRGRHGV